MAEIYLARQTGYFGLQKNVVVKCLLPGLTGDAKAVERFFADAKIGVTIQHANIVMVLDMGDVYQQYFVVLEHIEGWDLGRVLRSCRASGAPFPPQIACRILSEVCSALSAAHGAVDESGAIIGVARREMKPSDVLISSRGSVKLTNAWTIKPSGARSEAPANTETNVDPSSRGLATRGRVPACEPTGADVSGTVVSVGAILFEMLSLDSFFSLEPEASERGVRRRRIPEGGLEPEIREMLETLIDRATTRAPGHGYGSFQDLQLEIERVLFRIGVPVTTGHVSSWVGKAAAG